MAKEEKINGRRKGKKSRYSETFQRQVSLIILQENLTLREGAERFGIPAQTLSRWTLRYYNDLEITNVATSMGTSSPAKKTEELGLYEDKLKEAQLKITALETMIMLAEAEYKIAIRKNFGTKQHE